MIERKSRCTVKELIDFLNSIENKENNVYVTFSNEFEESKKSYNIVGLYSIEASTEQECAVYIRIQE